MPKRKVTCRAWEIWKPVVGYDVGYEVSASGAVRRCAYVDRSGHTRGARLVSQHRNHKGYARVALRCDGNQVVRMVHRLVLEVFSGPRPDGYECRHLDGDRTNNSSANLRWGTRQENEADKVVHGTATTGERNGRAKVTAQLVSEMRSLSSTLTVTRLADVFGISRRQVRRILTGTHWRAREARKLDAERRPGK